MSKHERSNEIRRDIERTRRDMDDTVDELGSRMSPGQFLDQAWSMIRSQGSGAGNVLSEHPVPLAIMGLGVAWLAIERASGSRHAREHHVGVGTYAPAEGRVGPYLGGEIGGEGHRGIKGRVKKGVKGAASTVKEKTIGTREWAASKLGHAGHGVSGAAHAAGDVATHAGEAIRHRADDAKHGIGSFLDSSPLAAGAIAFGLGIASGLSAPGSHLEDRMMGDTSDALKHSVSDTARDVGRRVKHVAGDAASAARAEADREEGLKTRAKHVSDDVSSRGKGRSSNR